MPDGGDGGDGGDGDGGGWENGLGDDIIEEDLTESEIKEIEANSKVEIAQAAQAAKARGKLPGKLAEMVADILNVKTPWYDILERWMTDCVKQDQTWTRPNRRHIGAGVYLPSMATEPAMGELAIQVDVSGSITKRELNYYNGHLSRIVKQCNPTKVHVLYTDTNVQKYVEFEQGEEIKLEFYSGGGTDMPAGFDYLNNKGINPAVFVCLTDGYTGFGKPPSYPVVWCISSDVTASHGETIHFEME